jgi:hypothetical protein
MKCSVGGTTLMNEKDPYILKRLEWIIKPSSSLNEDEIFGWYRS